MSIKEYLLGLLDGSHSLSHEGIGTVLERIAQLGADRARLKNELLDVSYRHHARGIEIDRLRTDNNQLHDELAACMGRYEDEAAKARRLEAECTDLVQQVRHWQQGYSRMLCSAATKGEDR